MKLESAKDLEVYQLAYDLAMRVFELSKGFPPEERYALTSQIRRSSRSVCLNLREAWAKRRYEAHFIAKLTDSDGLRLGEPTFDGPLRTPAYGSESESAETDSSLDFARDCRYITDGNHEELTAMNRSVGKMLGSMLKNPGPFLIPTPGQ